ncbi:MAG: SH3 domain-containing protein [Bacillota bacterium]
MKRFLSAVLCILMLAAFASQSLAFSGDSNLARSKVSAKQILKGVSVNFGMSSYPTDELPTKVTLINYTSHGYSFGIKFSVERKIDGKWYALPEDPNIAYPMIGLLLAANAMEDFDCNLKSGFGLYAPVPGEYRLLWRMQDEETGAWGYASGEFKLHPPGVLTLYATEPVYVRSGPGTKYPITNELPRGGTVEYLGESGKWTKCLYDPYEPAGSIAYVYSEYLGFEKPEPGKLLYATVPVSVRAGAGALYEALGTLEAGEAVEYMGKSGRWVKIGFYNRTAFVYGKYLTEWAKCVVIVKN